MGSLKRLDEDEALLVQSGKPVGVFRTHADAPRVLIANSKLVPHWATCADFNELDRKGIAMYGQMTAGSWIYIGSQGIVQGTHETFVAVLAGIALFCAWRRGWVADARTDRAPQPASEPGDAYRVFIILTLTMACAGFVCAGLTNTVPKMFEVGLGDGLATSFTQIGLLVGIVSGTASASGIFGGWLADRFSARSIYLVFWMLQIPPLFVIASMTGATLLLVALLVLSFNLSFSAAGHMLVAQYTPTRWRSLAYGAKFILALGVAGLTVIFAGWVFDSRGSFDLLYVWLGAAAIVAAMASALLPGRRRPVPAPAGPD